MAVYAAYGISDVFDLRTELFRFGFKREGQSFQLLGFSGGISYKLDVLEWIPYAGLELGYYHFLGGVQSSGVNHNQLGMSVDGGVDYRLSPNVGLGIELRYHGFLGNPMASLADAAVLTGLLRAEYHWGS